MNYSMPENLLEELNVNMTPNYYETSNKRDYKGTPGKPAPNARPATSTFYTSTEKTDNSGYKSPFPWKIVDNDDCGRPGTASGQRKNNPHPKEAFMVWKFPDKSKQSDEKLKEDLMEELCRDKIRSTYQVDYEKEKRKINENIPKKDYHAPPHTLNTTVRVDYQSPSFIEILKGNTTRYGCNQKRDKIASGAVPTVQHSASTMKTSYGTSYTNDFNMMSQQKSQISNTAQYLKNMSLQERKVIKDMVSKVTKNTNNGRSEAVSRISNWEGPSWK